MSLTSPRLFIVEYTLLSEKESSSSSSAGRFLSNSSLSPGGDKAFDKTLETLPSIPTLEDLPLIDFTEDLRFFARSQSSAFPPRRSSSSLSSPFAKMVDMTRDKREITSAFIFVDFLDFVEVRAEPVPSPARRASIWSRSRRPGRE